MPKSDAKVQTLLANREDVFDDYHGEGLEAAFSRFYRILESTPIRGSDRVLYRMERASEVRS